MMTNATQARPDIAAILAPRARRGWGTRAVAWILLACLLAGVALVAQRMIQSNDAAAAAQYVTEAVTRGDLAVKVSATGNLKPTNTVDVGSELSGLVVSVFVDDNQTVKRGQVLARLDTQRLQDQITQSEAMLAAAQARLAQTDATVKESAASLARLREVSRLSGGKVPSQTEMESAEATAARADADRLSATWGWYHWHATATDIETVADRIRLRVDCAVRQAPDAMFGYAFDGIPLYGSADAGNVVRATWTPAVGTSRRHVTMPVGTDYSREYTRRARNLRANATSGPIQDTV
ncbi:MAG TPA: biotin/lipoyl-binding protein [Vicinamibacterales bacterium]|nr:biotin/lipoyl-binding protein [Vicinamibacterales bacterium]